MCDQEASVAATLAPPEFARPGLRFLQELDVSANFLAGAVPDSLSLLVALRVLRLNRNWFVGRVPASLGQLALLEHLELQGNLFDAAVDGDSVLPAQCKRSVAMAAAT